MASTTGVMSMNASMAGTQDRVTYSKSNVVAKLCEDDADTRESGVSGVLSVVEKPHGIFVEWSPERRADDVSTADWVLTSADAGHSPKSSTNSPTSTTANNSASLAFSVDIKELSSFYLHEKGRKVPVPWLKFFTKDGSSYTPLYFTCGGNAEFVTALQRYAMIKRSAKEKNLIVFTDEKTEELHQSMSALFHKDAANQRFFSKLMADPYTTALNTLGKVGNALQDQMFHTLLDDGVDIEENRELLNSLINIEPRDESDDLMRHDDAGFELVSTRVDFPDRPRVQREAPLSAAQWQTHRNDDGSFKHVRQLKAAIFRGGVIHNLRKEAWKYLLGYYDWRASTAELAERRKQLMDDYYRMKLQWKSMDAEQEERFTLFRDYKGLVEKDVARTDRTIEQFEGDGNVNIQMLNDILMTYVMYDFDLGYVQGMSDFLSPILVVMENEVDAFWCFVGLMKMMHRNFELDQSHIRVQLMQLRDLLMVVNPKLANYLESHHCDNMYFTFRWLLVLFKREFKFRDVMRLWEVLWTEILCVNFHLLVCVAILDRQMNTIIQNKFGLSETLKHINDLSMQIPLEETLCQAEAIYHQLAATQDKLPGHIAAILGFHSDEEQQQEDGSSSHNSSPVKLG